MKVYLIEELSTGDKRLFKTFLGFCNAYGFKVQAMRNLKSRKGLPMIKEYNGSFIVISEKEVE